MKKVLHLVRKNTQLQSSFIRNQIIYHEHFKPYIAFCEERSLSNYQMLSIFEQLGIELFSVSIKHNILTRYIYKNFGILFSKQRKKLNDIIYGIKPDIIHIHYGSDAVIYLRILENYRIPFITSFYGYDCFSFPKRGYGIGKYLLNRYVFKKSTYILAMSPEMQADLVKLGCPKNKIIVHYHGVPSDLTSIQRSYEDKEFYKLLMLSYIDPVKGHIFVLNSLKCLLNKGIDNFKLIIVGDGHFKEKVISKISELKLHKYVEMFGNVDYLSEQYFKVFSEADIFLHPSVLTKEDKEGIPGSLVEAMFAGLPVIATHHGGIPYVIENGQTGILVHENDTTSLANAISNLISSKFLREQLGRRARTFAVENLDIRIREKHLENIYLKSL